MVKLGGTAKHAFAPCGVQAFFAQTNRWDFAIQGDVTHMQRYEPLPALNLPDRQWPSRRLKKAPTWCAVDLRDGNQALVEPMSVEEKLSMFRLLVQLGFREIEIGFPSASQTEFDTARALIERDLIPENVTVQVLTQARGQLIHRTFEALEGARNAIFHLYTNISPMFRQVVYQTDEAGCIDLAVRQIAMIRELAAHRSDGGKGVRFEYSPECFTEAEPEFAMRVLEAVIEEYGASAEDKIIINLPSTVQKTLPNEYADRIEQVHRFLRGRENVILSVHPHNDRGTGIAEAELAMLAGAERIEGTLFGNGERTGNVDIVTLALNLESHGIASGLDFSQVDRVRETYERCTRMHVYERAPYAGDLVFTAFSGSHQDAIRKGLEYQRNHPEDVWRVPYLPMDPQDVGRNYEPIIRINSQSGKGGAAFVMQTRFGYNLPRAMHPEFGQLVKREADLLGTELPPERILHLFLREYQGVESPYCLEDVRIAEGGTAVYFDGAIRVGGTSRAIHGEGNGPIDAFFSAMLGEHIDGFTFVSYHEHAIGAGSDAKACAYIQLKYQGQDVFGVGIHASVSVASIHGVLCAINRALNKYDGRSRQEAPQAISENPGT